MEQFAPYIGITLVGLGIIGIAVCVWRIVSLFRSNRGRSGRMYPNADGRRDSRPLTTCVRWLPLYSYSRR